ncbi:MAG: nascent polypeptide-associated complex protein [archaeon]
MIPGINPRKMAQMMKKMGIQQVEIPATEVIIRTPDKDLVVTEPQVSKVNMMGQETLQIVGHIHEVERSDEPDVNEEDVRTVMEQANVTEEAAKEAIQKHKGDLAAAILELSSKDI